MRGLMMDHPLLISSLIDYAADVHGHVKVVSQTVEGPIHRYTWADVRERSARLAHGLAGLGIGVGDRVGTIAWNGYRHLEVYYGSPRVTSRPWTRAVTCRSRIGPRT